MRTKRTVTGDQALGGIVFSWLALGVFGVQPRGLGQTGRNTKTTRSTGETPYSQVLFSKVSDSPRSPVADAG